MEILENFKEGLRSIQGNLFRSLLTALIIAIGISSLVGIITAIDGIKASIDGNLSTLGANTFRVVSVNNGNRGNEDGKARKMFPPVKYSEFQIFKENFKGADDMTLYAYLTWNAEVKYQSVKTNPNVRIIGADGGYLAIEGVPFKKGRDFTAGELKNGAPVVVIGKDIEAKLFPSASKINPIGKYITAYGASLRVIGVLDTQGAMGSNSGVDRAIVLPLERARMLAAGQGLSCTLKVALNDFSKIDPSIGRATAVMRAVRGDRPGEENSFEVKADQSLADRLGDMSLKLKIGGLGIGLITILGAAIGLMNIMMVSVTERTREIGVRKALGATPHKIKMQFLMEAITICLIGGLTGIVLGFIFGNAVGFVVKADSLVFPVGWMLFGFFISILVGVLSGYLPAAKASRLDPIESLRFE
ncbi:ABC transporter permease [Persicobacter psychrovividus]|uniref:ABC transporter permease n=1 Tax=Persicobacter psychrovividus TaxID=387638 RepID=A0ABM7VF61_9BACT|nr:ABC transporter permease [Persicobacter psychrovividus]